MISSTTGGLRLTEEEAYALLSLCLTSPNGLDATSERALRKLAEYCTSGSNPVSNHINLETHYGATCELRQAGA
jgi:hypothetical protein